MRILLALLLSVASAFAQANYSTLLLLNASAPPSPPTFFGSASAPADAGSQSGTGPHAITPPADMVAGDLVVILAADRSVGTISMSEAGGQTWTELSQHGGPTISMQWSWCEFDGTWDANPSMTSSGADAFTLIMLVFRPGNASESWSVDVASATETFAAPSTPFDVTATGLTTTVDNAVVLWGMCSIDDNVWGLQSGADAAVSVRNTFSGDTATSAVYKIQSSAGASGSMVNRQTTLGGDQGRTISVAFKSQ